MSASLVRVEAGQILVVPAFVDMLTIGRLGGRFSGVVRCWVFPATPDNALLLRRKLRAIQETPEFTGLLSSSPAAEAPLSEKSLEALAVESAQDLVVEPPEPDVTIPDGMLTRPWRHQKAALKFCLEHFAAGFRGILLAMGMGTGKSMVACMLLLALSARRVLIACPLRVVQVWITQFERHVGVPVVIVALDEDVGSVAQKHEIAAEKMRLADTLGLPFIAVINYDSAWRDPFAAWAEKVNWDIVLADEAHRIKAPGGKASMFFKRMRLRANHRVALTGTPMPHGPMDIFAVFRFLDARLRALVHRIPGQVRRHGRIPEEADHRISEAR